MRIVEGNLIETFSAASIHARKTGLPLPVLAFTANATIRNGRLTMGGGAARAVRDWLPVAGVDDRLVREGLGLTVQTTRAVAPPYYIAHVDIGGFTVMAVQVKGDVDLPAKPENKATWLALACQSFHRLRLWSRENGRPIFVNMPLIGLGGFSSDEEKEHVEWMVRTVLHDADVTVMTLGEG